MIEYFLLTVLINGNVRGKLFKTMQTNWVRKSSLYSGPFSKNSISLQSANSISTPEQNSISTPEQNSISTPEQNSISTLENKLD